MIGSDISACIALVEELTEIGVSAALAIRQIQDPGGVRIKADGSPVTPADEASEAVIRAGLARLCPDVPVISEEAAANKKPAVTDASFFLVDPLDGTKEFVSGRDEYTVNIGLVAGGAPVLGVIVAPARGLIWRGIVGQRAERQAFAGQNILPPKAIHTRQCPDKGPLVMTSRSHLDPRTQAYFDRLPGAQRVASGSSVKFCRVAEGSADLYPRLAPTHDWDIAAGHAILVAAGGAVIAPDGRPLCYGTPELLIPAFIAWSGNGPEPTEQAVKG